MNYIEKSGKTVEDAVAAGLKELGKESSEVTIEVLQYGSPGLFGMFGKLAKVRLTVKEKEEDFDFEMPVFTLDQQSAKKNVKPVSKRVETRTESAAESAPRQESRQAGAVSAKARTEAKLQPEVEQVGAQKTQDQPLPQKNICAADKPDSPAEKAKAPRAPRQRKARQHLSAETEPTVHEQKPSVAFAEIEDLPPLDIETLSQDGRNAYDFLKQLTTLMNVDVEIRMKEDKDHLQVQMIGDTLGVLIGRRGDTLDALQYLTSLQVNKGRDEYLRVTLDTEHYRAKREEALRRLAERMANRARRTGHRVTLEPMNPYERRVLHSALQDNPYVTTHSEGEEPYRRVVITLK